MNRRRQVRVQVECRNPASSPRPRGGTCVRCNPAISSNRQFADVDRHRSGFDLRKIENVVDQREQVDTRAVNRLGKLDLFARQVAVRVFGKLIGQNQQAVERRAQLVRHVGEELRFVLRSKRELLTLFFQRLAGLFHFAVLALDFLVLFGTAAWLFFQFLRWSVAILPAALATRGRAIGIA